ncbi:hypothetical protein GCM10028801_11750 [Nocardioides maradonensis]
MEPATVDDVCEPVAAVMVNVEWVSDRLGSPLAAKAGTMLATCTAGTAQAAVAPARMTARRVLLVGVAVLSVMCWSPPTRTNVPGLWDRNGGAPGNA